MMCIDDPPFTKKGSAEKAEPYDLLFKPFKRFDVLPFH